MSAAEKRLRRVLDLLPSWAGRTTDGGLKGALIEVYGFDAKATIDGTADALLTAKVARDLAIVLGRGAR